ncbi:MAG TPA: hypothetical protein VFH42_00270 [Sporolactobacillaceae bacterium]|nr:hypothetical protein [Sporolactobacillaceae bacterium]
MNEKIYNLLQAEGKEVALQISFHPRTVKYSRESAYQKTLTYAKALGVDMELHRTVDDLRWYSCEERDKEDIKVVTFYHVYPFKRLQEQVKISALGDATTLFPDLEIDELRESLEENTEILFDAAGELDAFHGSPMKHYMAVSVDKEIETSDGR